MADPVQTFLKSASQALSLSFGSFPNNPETKPVLDEPNISIWLSSDDFQAL